jgi:mono/diheme cytochrome c family protein
MEDRRSGGRAFGLSVVQGLGILRDLCGRGSGPRFRLSTFWATVLSLAITFILLRYGVPYVSMLVVDAQSPLPVPGALMAFYAILVIAGAWVYLTFDERRWVKFNAPIWTFLRGNFPGESNGIKRFARQGILALIPLLVGWLVYGESLPEASSPTALRIQHPTIPGAFEKLQNPYRNPSDEMAKRFLAEKGLNVSPEEGRTLVTRAAHKEGRQLYVKNCQWCHGDGADGAGPLARGFRLRPANFRDPGTIATVVEAYAFWRVKEGGPGLPPEATPWDSAMPVWKTDLTEEQIWKVVMAAYDAADVEPRQPEKLH